MLKRTRLAVVALILIGASCSKKEIEPIEPTDVVGNHISNNIIGHWKIGHESSSPDFTYNRTSSESNTFIQFKEDGTYIEQYECVYWCGTGLDEDEELPPPTISKSIGTWWVAHNVVSTQVKHPYAITRQFKVMDLTSDLLKIELQP